MSDYVQVVTTTEKENQAAAIGRALVEQRLAACVQLSGPITSIYRWKGTVETACEWRCVAKTRRDRYAEVEKAIRSRHPYDEPEIVALPLVAGSASYLAWVDEQTRGKKHEPGEAEREGAPGVVKYEMEMLRRTVKEWVQGLGKRPRCEPWRGSALLDSVLLHARNMYDFLTHSSSAKDDIVAGHFARNADGSPWTTNLPMCKSLLRDTQKFRHHLTYSRVTKSRRRWEPKEIECMLNKIEAAYRDFVEHLPESERDNWSV